jgi:hypothetical protein
MAGFASCETADQTAAPISPDYKPTVTVTSDVTGKVNEGSQRIQYLLTNLLNSVTLPNNNWRNSKRRTTKNLNQ